MTQKFKKGQRVQITKGYTNNPVGEIGKYQKNFGTYNIKGDDGRNYNLVLENQITLVEPKEEIVIEGNAPEPAEKQLHKRTTPDSAIEQLKFISSFNDEITLSSAQVQKLVSEILELEKEMSKLTF